MRVAALLILVTVAAVACSNDRTQASGPDLEPKVLQHHHECAACGMIVAEQSVARAQLVHRDGTREYFCSIGDMLAYLGAPSPHGRVVGTWVEAMDPTKDPRTFYVDKQPWLEAANAFYVTGIPKRRVMGKPVMVYRTREQAKAVADKFGGTIADWQRLRQSK